ncbi:BglG family transcription antiterminator [Lacticaseibacillus zhaodongensis]|uniref:BglG family transcription antiterminator n=1 Tax=Lacticaseibacillus zhaodongensis TaxID=2668065 RepID=UPI0012D351A6|nr:BglG family transcription antiterminator [Lacticaseibacillus zhaodongensis]
MLTKRQTDMLRDLRSFEGEFVKATYFEQKYNVSTRTVRNDIKALKRYAQTLPGFEIKSVTAHGTVLNVLNRAEYLATFDDDTEEESSKRNLGGQDERVYRIISELFRQKEGMSAIHLASRLFVSKSTLQNDMHLVKTILSKYDIALVNHRGSGYQAVGDEVNIRRAIREEKLDSLPYAGNLLENPEEISHSLESIGRIVVEELNNYQIRISNVSLQNLIVHLKIMVTRIHEGFVINDVYPDQLVDEMSKEITVAKAILGKIASTFGFSLHDSEIKRLALYLKGKADYSDASYISEDVDKFVIAGLEQIDRKFGVNFADNMQLRIALALHIIPLRIRLEYNMQLENPLLDTIQKSYQIALDMAAVFGYALQETFGYRLSEGEISYFALYFNHALITDQEKKSAGSVLVISSLKRSENLLLSERLRYWLSNRNVKIDIVPSYEVDLKQIDQYEVVCSTEENQFVAAGLAIPISNFPTEADYKRIAMALDGYSSKEGIMSLFKEANIVIGSLGNKKDIIRKLSTMIINQNPETNVDLYHEVMLREEMGGTYFGNGVAIPHTIHPVLDQTQIAVAILPAAIAWDDNDSAAQIVIMVSLEKNNPKAFRLWQYLSAFTGSPDLIQNVLLHPTKLNFRKQMESSLDRLGQKLPEH